MSAGVYRAGLAPADGGRLVMAAQRHARDGLTGRIAGGAPLLLDGATGTELERRGIPTPLPLWSARALIDAPEIVARIHADYVAVGVEALTANTFRTHRRSLARGGWGERAEALTVTAVALARGAAEGAGRPVFVLGSAPPLEDCYRPDLVPGADALTREHAEHARHLVRAGADGALVETMNTRREAVAATHAAVAAGLPVLTSFVCWEGATLLSGEPLAEAAAAVRDAGAQAVLVNCLPPGNVDGCLEVLSAQALPFGVYANLGAPDDESGFARSEDCTPEAFAAHVERWVRGGAHIVGGCCGTTPAHLRAVAAALDRAGFRTPEATRGRAPE